MQRERDSNPRYPFGVYTLSRRAPSATRTPLCLWLDPLRESECKEKNYSCRFQTAFGIKRKLGTYLTCNGLSKTKAEFFSA